MKTRQFYVLIYVVHFRSTRFKIFSIIVKIYIALSELSSTQSKNVVEHFSLR